MKKLALLLVECALLLGLLEVGLRVAVPAQVDVPHLRVHAEGFYTWYPGARFTYHNLPHVEPPSAPVRVNALGLRGPELPDAKPAGERRVLVVGDSYTAAVQLPEDRIFTTLLERELNADAGAGRYRVVNAGVNGAGTAHELLYFRHAAAALAPDVAVLQFAWNDVADTRAHAGFRLTAAGLELRDDLRTPPFWRGPLLAARDALANHSLTFFLLYRLLTGTRAEAAERSASTPALGAADTPDVALVVRLVAEFIRTANDAGAPVILLTIPAPLYIGQGDPVYAEAVRAFAALVAGTRNQLIVADPLLLAAERRGERTFLEHDGHLSAAGHRVIADALAPAVLRYDPSVAR